MLVRFQRDIAWVASISHIGGQKNTTTGQKIKAALKAFAERFGYRIRRVHVPNDPDSVVAATLSPAEGYLVFTTPCPIYQPWRADVDFQSLMEGVPELTLVSAERCFLLWTMARYAAGLGGDFAECGVYRGGTALLLARTLRELECNLWLFDSFEGLPKTDADAGDAYVAGRFNDVSYENVRRLLEPFSTYVRIVRGWLPGTFGEVSDRRFAFAHVDVDVYDAAKACCEFLYPRLVEGGVMVFDDYGFPACRGERNAVDEFFGDRSVPVTVLSSGQALVIKGRGELSPAAASNRA